MPGLAISLIQGSLRVLQYRLCRIAPAIDRRGTAGRHALAVDRRQRDPQLDSTAAGMLVELCADLRERGIRLGLAELHAEGRDAQRAGVIDSLGSDMVFDNLEAAYQAYEADRDRAEAGACACDGSDGDPGKLGERERAVAESA